MSEYWNTEDGQEMIARIRPNGDGSASPDEQVMDIDYIYGHAVVNWTFAIDSRGSE